MGKKQFYAPNSLALGQFQPCDCTQEFFKKYKKNEISIHFLQKFTMVTYNIKIE
jgi:hypothetical protein